MDEFLRDLFEDGRIVVRGRPLPLENADRRASAGRLGSAFEAHRLDVAGPPISFDLASALAATELVRWAAWFLVDRSEPSATMASRLVMPRLPKSAAEHLSADLTLRFLPELRRRASATDPGDGLAGLLADVLRVWPLSGSLGDVEGVAEDPELAGHPGLRLLHAERLARRDRSGRRSEGVPLG